jgi:hypothetical protein
LVTQSFDEAERPALLASLEYQRACVRSIVDGMSEELDGITRRGPR